MQLLLVLLLIVAAVGYAGYRVYKALSRPHGVCEGCEGCAFRQQMRRNAQPGEMCEQARLRTGGGCPAS